MKSFFKWEIATVRFWLLKKLFTHDEKYLISTAINDRVDNLERIAVNERCSDKDNIRVDCDDYLKLKTIFSNKRFRLEESMWKRKSIYRNKT